MPAENDGKKNPHSSPQKRGRYKRKKGVFFGLSSFSNTYRREQRANRKQEETEDASSYWVDVATLIFVIFTFFGIVIQDIILHSTDNTASKSLIATTRPWMQIDSLEPETLVIIDDGLHVGMRIHYTNAGNSPAHGIDVVADIREGGVSRKDAKAKCPNIKVDGPSVFAKETSGQPVDFHLTGLAKLVNRPNFSRWGSPAVFGCLAYYFEGSDVLHYTTFIGILARKLGHSAPGNGGGQGIDLLANGWVNPEDLEVLGFEGGTSAD